MGLDIRASSPPAHVPGCLAACSTWRKLDAAGKPAKEVGDIAQLRVLLRPRSGADAVPLDYG